jgi:hypothetical protein
LAFGLSGLIMFAGVVAWASVSKVTR